MPNDRLTHLNTSLATPWVIDNNRLCKTFMFTDFQAAFAFMTRVATLAEAMQHHPDWTNVYNRVDVRLNTHDAGGVVTDKDFALAQKMEEAARG